jgi:hypothetical protein
MPEVLDRTGVIYDLPAEEYFAIPALSNSGMKDLAVSPLRFWFHHINPERPAREETAAMKLGSALHCAVLERDEVFESRYACALDPSDWVMCLDTIDQLREWITSKGHKPVGTKKGPMVEQALAIMDLTGERIPILQNEQRIFFAANEGKTILTPEEWRKCTGMTRALTNEPAIQRILAEGKPEVAYVVTDPETGVRLKARMDWRHPEITFDGKTFVQKMGRSIDESVNSAIYYEGYYKQAWLYDHIRFIAEGKRAKFVMGFVESEEPHEVRIKRLKDDGHLYWNKARIDQKALIELYARCWEQFGDKPWRTSREIEVLEDEDVKQVIWSS